MRPAFHSGATPRGLRAWRRDHDLAGKFIAIAADVVAVVSARNMADHRAAASKDMRIPKTLLRGGATREAFAPGRNPKRPLSTRAARAVAYREPK